MEWGSEERIERPTFNIQPPTLNERQKGRTSNLLKLNKMPQRETPKYDLEERLLEYSAGIIKLAEGLPTSRTGSHVAGQLLRSGTSPYANHGEAQAAESANDFVHKMRICLKELRETKRWLRLIQRVPLVKPSSKMDTIIDETEELIKIFATSIRTAEKNIKK